MVATGLKGGVGALSPALKGGASWVRIFMRFTPALKGGAKFALTNPKGRRRLNFGFSPFRVGGRKIRDRFLFIVSWGTRYKEERKEMYWDSV